MINEKFINETNQFIEMVFNYYNGRINTFNRAVLKIEWVITPSRIIGQTRNPNIVTIYPLVIFYISDEKTMKYLIIESIIHELYHIDQNINYRMMVSNRKYLYSIESAVEKQTNLYILNNSNEIYNIFGVSIIDGYQIYKINQFNDGVYIKKNWYDHIINMISEIFIINNLPNDLENNIRNTNKNINIRINNDMIILRSNTKLLSIENINNFFYDKYFKYTTYKISRLEYIITDYDISIGINVRLYKNICNIN